MPDLDPMQRILEQEQTIRQLIQARLSGHVLIHPDQQEHVSYRLAEIFVTARTLYTNVLPRFMDADGDEEDVFEGFGEVRMNLLHLRDLIADFEESFLTSLDERQAADEEDEKRTTAPPEPFEDEEEEDEEEQEGEPDSPPAVPPSALN